MTNLKQENGNNIENLIHAYLSGTILQKEKDELFHWLVQDAKNVVCFNQISDIWLSASVFQEKEKFNANEAYDRVLQKINDVNDHLSDQKIRTIKLTWLKVAAILIPIIFLSSLATKLIFISKTTLTENPFSFEVPYGSKAIVTLPDGSTVMLNAGSKLTCNEGFGKTNRNLNLVGEGYFNVAKNKKIPFLVHAGGLDVRALGTEFNVKAYPEDKNIEAILIHGSIQINKTIEQGKGGKPLILLPKQSLVYDKKSDSFVVNILLIKKIPAKGNSSPDSIAPNVIVSKTNIDPIIFTTWKEKSWTIYGIELSDLAIDLERKYDVNIHFNSEALKKIKFTGTLPDISLEQVLAAIRLTSPIDFKIKGKQVELSEDQSMISSYKRYYRNTEQN